MTDEKKTTTLEDTVEQAERLEAEALAEEDAGIYTHILTTPLTYEGSHRLAPPSPSGPPA